MVDKPTHTPLTSPGDNSFFVQLKSLLRLENRSLVVVLVKHLLSELFSHVAFLEKAWQCVLFSRCGWEVWARHQSDLGAGPLSGENPEVCLAQTSDAALLFCPEISSSPVHFEL